MNLKVAKQQHISCTAQFKHADMANIDVLDATPCSTSTPKPCNQVWLSPSPPGTSDIKMTDDHDFNKAGFKPPSASNSATEDYLVDLVSEEDSVVGSGPPKK